MMRKISKTVVVLLCWLSIAHLSANSGNWEIKKGEKLYFRLAFSSALTGNIKGGEATLSVGEKTKEIDGKEVYDVTMKGNTTGIIEWVYSVKNVYKSYINIETNQPIMYIQQVKENKYSKNDTILFGNDKISFGNKSFKSSPNTQDMISFFYVARAQDFEAMKKGDSFTVSFVTGEGIMQSKVRYLGTERKRTKFGTNDCYVLQPQVPSGKVFTQSYPAKLWITKDDNRYPVLIESKMKVGKIRLEMTKVE